MDLNNKKILITGGTGSWGQELTKQLLEKFNVKKITILSRNENAQVIMRRKFSSDKLKFIIGDVRDINSITKASKDIDIVFHLAALKHVPLSEENPDEFIQTNITGTQNVRDAAINNGVKKVVLISTDKACAPTNLYGYTKSIAEKIIIQANCITDKTKFVCIRGGNALGSNGSVVPLFIEQIKKNNKLTITDERMTRFFLTLQEAVSLIFSATENSYGGEIFVMRMPAFKIKEIAELVIEAYGNKESSIETIGMKAGEKIHEVLISEHESKLSYNFDENYIFINSPLYIESMKDVELTKFSKFDKQSFSSEEVKPKKMLKEFLQKGGFL
jgi:FlaA1/EpsC-like NDP-sugar epimerase